jgi:Ca2+-binding EF-hand superfamily protein
MEMDEDNNGFLTASEFYAMLKVVDPPVWTDTAVRRLLRALDKNKDGVVNFEEFVEWAFTRGSGNQAGEKVLKTAWRLSGKRRVERLFDDCDWNGDGVIDSQELAAMLKELDPSKWDEDTIPQLLKAVDKDKSGEISFREFLDWAFGDEPESEVIELALDPERAKVESAPVVMKPVVIEPKGGRHVNVVLVSMYTASGGWHKGDVTIHYTLDGSEPTESSARYEGPLAVKKGKVEDDGDGDPDIVFVKAFAVSKDRRIDGTAVTTEVFRFVHPTELSSSNKT